MRKQIFIILAVIALVGSSYWTFNSGYNTEAILAVVASIGGLIRALFTDKFSKGSQSAMIKGSRNSSRQYSKTGNETEIRQDIKIVGDDNENIQELGF